MRVQSSWRCLQQGERGEEFRGFIAEPGIDAANVRRFVGVGDVTAVP